MEFPVLTMKELRLRMICTEVPGYIAFAVNNFARAICSDEFRKKNRKEDVLTVGLDEIPLYDNVKKEIASVFWRCQQLG